MAGVCGGVGKSNWDESLVVSSVELTTGAFSHESTPQSAMVTSTRGVPSSDAASSSAHKCNAKRKLWGLRVQGSRFVVACLPPPSASSSKCAPRQSAPNAVVSDTHNGPRLPAWLHHPRVKGRGQLHTDLPTSKIVPLLWRRAPNSPILCRTSKPVTTLPNTTCFPAHSSRETHDDHARRRATR